eukprot:861390-Pelagomonas_calceolata.AAC.5
MISNSRSEVVGARAWGSACSSALVNSACAAVQAIHCTLALPVVTQDCRHVAKDSSRLGCMKRKRHRPIN